MLERSWNRPPGEGLRLEAEIQRRLIGSPNQIAAVTAGITKEPAAFEDPVAEHA